MDKQSVKEHVLSQSVWIRIVYMLLFWVIGNITLMLVGLAALLQAILSLVTGSPNVNLQEFTLGLSRYLSQTARFLTFNSATKPFPFSDWPEAEHAQTREPDRSDD